MTGLESLLTGALILETVLLAGTILALNFSSTEKNSKKEVGADQDEESLKAAWAPITADRRFDQYLADCAQIQEFAQKNADSFEKAMLTLSGGALGLSITFLGLIKDKEVEIGTSFLIPLSWLLFAISLGFMIMSYRATHDSYDRQLSVLDENYFYYSSAQNELREQPGKLSSYAILCLYAGIVSFCIFGFFNAGNIMEEKKRPTRINDQKGNPPRVSPIYDRPPAQPQPGQSLNEGNAPRVSPIYSKPGTSVSQPSQGKTNVANDSNSKAGQQDQTAQPKKP